MKIKLCKGDGKKSDTLYLKFEEVKECVVISVALEDGTAVIGGALLRISEKGVFFFPGVRNDLNLPIDVKGYLKIEGVWDEDQTL